MGYIYTREAVQRLGLEKDIGILKIGTTWPLPDNLIKKHLKHAEKVLFVEEIDPFLEDNVKIIYAESNEDLGKLKFFGKNTGDISGSNGPGVGEMNTDIVLDALTRLFNIKKKGKATYKKNAADIAKELLIPREISFCQGCPHRASFYAIKAALTLDGRKGFVVGDIGCYGLAAGATGFNQIKALHCMGSGMGNASGFSKLSGFGFDQPVVAVVGDSTFYHAVLPALINAKFNDADALFCILDNTITAMTGFQINPATPCDYSGQPKPPIITEKITESLGIKTVVMDPVEDIQKAMKILYELLQEKGLRIVVFRRACATYETKNLETKKDITPMINPDKCIGDECGCNQFCSSTLGCPAIQFDSEISKAYILEDACNGCGLCAQLCPEGAIS